MGDVTDEEHLYWMRHAISLAERAAEQGEVPVGAVIVKAGKLLAEGWNQPIALHDASAHAEIMAIRAAGQCDSNYRLVDTQIYVTLEPCVMCVGAIIHARISHVIYGATDSKAGACGSRFTLLPSQGQFNHDPECQGGVLADQCAALLQNFFRQRRNQKAPKNLLKTLD